MITVLLVDDHRVVREGLRAFLDVQGDLEVIGEAADGRTAVEMATRLGPDVVLLDLKMPGMDGLEVLRELAGVGAAARVIVLTSYTDPASVVPALRAGAAGFLDKDVDPVALAHAIRSAHHGQVLLAPEMTAALLASDLRPERLTALTPRELDVLGEIARGRSNREIARVLGLSEKTVKTHVSAILMKLAVSDRTQAA
ncbi:MAG: response regulator transcription factor, partial [Actinomycetes bacterium]